MIRLETLLLLGIGIALVPHSTDGQRVTFPRRPQGRNICVTNQNQEMPNCCDAFLMCSAAGAVGTFMRCAEGTLFDDTVGFCNVIFDANHQCHPSNARRCFNNQRQGLRNNFRNTNNRLPNNPRRAQFRNTNSFNTLPPPFTNNNQNTRFGRNRFNNNRNQNTVTNSRNQNRFNSRNRNQNTVTNNRNRNRNNRFTTTRIPNNRFGRTQTNRFQTNNRNRFNTIRFTTPNGNRGPFQAPARIELTIRDVRPGLRNVECIRFQTEVNSQFSELAQRMLGAQAPVLSIQCQPRQNTRG